MDATSQNELPAQLEEIVLKSLDTVYNRISSSIERGTQQKGNLAKGTQNLLIEFIIQLLKELGVIKQNEEEDFRKGIESLIFKYQNSRGEL